MRVEARLKTMNSFAPILRCQQSNVSVDSVLNIKGFDLKRTLEMDPEFLNTDGEHVHDNTVSSVSIKLKATSTSTSIQQWISSILQEKGADIFRMKGVLAIAHAEERFVYQAVHMIFTGDFMEKWEPGEKRESKLVFIGKNLDRAELTKSFEACKATPEAGEARKKALRFQVGSRVECNTGGGSWSPGKVVALMYRDDGMPSGMVAPYQVQLDNGDLIYAPAVGRVVARAEGDSECVACSIRS